MLLNRIADPCICAHSEVVAEAPSELLESSIHLIFISYLEDAAIFIRVQFDCPQVEPGFFCLQPFEYSGFESIDIIGGKTNRRASPTEAARKIIASTYRNDAKNQIVGIDPCFGEELDYPYHWSIAPAYDNFDLAVFAELYFVKRSGYLSYCLFFLFCAEEVDEIEGEECGLGVLEGEFAIGEGEVLFALFSSAFGVDEQKVGDSFVGECLFLLHL